MELWRAGKPGEALPHLMTAIRDPEVSFYAARQVALMGRYALPILYRGLWHEEEAIRRQSAVILGWIGEPEAVDPLLMRMEFPDCPTEVEYALRKINALSSDKLLAILARNDLSNRALLDHQTASFVRLARAVRLAVDPVPLLRLVEAIENRLGASLAGEPFGHAASARLNLLLFLAERKVSLAARPLVRAIEPEADETNLAIAQTLVELGEASLEPLEEAFRAPRYVSLRPLFAVTHFLSSGASEASWKGPASTLLNEIQEEPELLRLTANWAARLSLKPNPFLAWFTHHPDPEVRKALAPDDLKPEEITARAALKDFYLERTRDPDSEVAAAHLLFAARFVPDFQVEARLQEILGSIAEPAPVREAALRSAATRGAAGLLLGVLRSPGDPLRATAVRLSTGRSELELVDSVLAIIREPEPSEAKRAAVEVAASYRKRPEAKALLLDLLRSGDPLWLEAARGLAALGAQEAAEPFVALVDSGRPIDRDEAGSLYFALTGVPAHLAGESPGAYRFDPIPLEDKPPEGKVLVVLEERTDYLGWVKVEELWEGRRIFHLDGGELTLYDRDLFDKVGAGARILLLDENIRQVVLSPLELSERRLQRARAITAFPDGRLAGLDGERLWLLSGGRLLALPLGKDLRLEEDGSWGRAALVPFEFLDRERIRFAPIPPPSGWPLGQAQPNP